MAKKSSKKKSSAKSSFSKRHGSKSDVFKGVTPEQLGHDQQMPVNPPTPGGSPLMAPGGPGQLGIGMSPVEDMQ